jgi:hypothetical protein
MATVDGTPDLSAVRRYERLKHGRSQLDTRPMTRETATTVVERINHQYREDAEFLSFQGVTATRDDLEHAGHSGVLWLGSHLFHHWDVHAVDEEVVIESARTNAGCPSPPDWIASGWAWS